MRAAVSRWSSSGGRHQLVHATRDAKTRSWIQQTLLNAGRPLYAVWYHKLSMSPLGRLFVSYSYYPSQLKPEERDVFVKATRPVYEKWKNTVGAALVKEAEDAIAARKK